MLITDCFRKDLVMHSNEENDRWDDYDFQYMQDMKCYLKKQLLEKFPNPKGLKFMIDRPMMLRKQIPLIMAIWELGGILVIYDLLHCLMSNPLYAEFNSNIDVCLLEHQDQKLNQLDLTLKVFADMGRLHELKYFDLDPEFGTIKEDPILAHEDDLALVVNTSGTTRAPTQVYYSHKQVLAFVKANQEHFEMNPNEHVLHLKSFHHGGLCVNFLLPTLATAKHHYFRIQHQQDEPVGEHVKLILAQKPINRMLFPYELTASMVDLIASATTLTADLTIQSTQTIKPSARITKLFSTGNVKRFIIMFGCGELPGAYLLQDIKQDDWPKLQESWDYTMFTETPGNFWSYKITEDGLGLKCPVMQDYHVPGDMFEKLPNGRWHWLGRNTQIKKEGRIVFPAAVETILNRQFSHNDILIVPDYKHKQLYAVVFANPHNESEDQLMIKFNQAIDVEADPYHRLDLIMLLNKQFIKGVPDRPPSMSAARFLARKKLGLSTE